MTNAANAAFSSSLFKRDFSMREKAAFVFLLFTLAIQTTFGQKNEQHFLKNGISFSYPEKWQIISDESIPDVGNYVSVERTGKSATGLFTLVWMDTEENTGKTILAQMESMKNANLYRNPGIEFTVVENSIFVGSECKEVNYVTIVKDLKIEGTIWCFNCSGKTIIVFYQSGIDDKKNNEEGFGLIKQTFACR